MENSKGYKTLSQLMDAPAGECMQAIARVAPAIGTIAEKTGIFKLLFSDTVIKANSQSYMRHATKKERERIADEMASTGEQILLRLLKVGLGECLPEMQEVLAAINGISRDELLAKYSTREIIGMVKEVLGDDGFLSSMRTLTD